MHLFVGFVIAASVVLPEILAVDLVPLAHPESYALAVVRQTATQEAVPLPHSKGQEARQPTGRTALRYFGHLWIRAVPPLETSTA